MVLNSYQVKRAGVVAVALCMSCGGEASSRPSSQEEDCTQQGVCVEAVSCADETPVPSVWASWPMPNPASSGLAQAVSYDVTQPGVALDKITGLMWQRELEATDLQYTFNDAGAYCSALEAGGYCDWRLPTRIELVSLVDFTRTNPAVDAAVFPRTEGAFISSSLAAGQDARWSVHADGATAVLTYTNVPSTVRVRCVRLHTWQEVAETRYTFDTGATETVADVGTGLVWQRKTAATKYTFAKAQEYCAALGDGFRVPSMKELQTVVDETAAERPSIDQRVFTEFPELTFGNAFFWTSSVSAALSGSNAWFVNFGNGAVTDFVVNVGSVVDNEYYVRCVR